MTMYELTMYELVQELAELQAERRAEENAANSDRRICSFELEIRDMESTLAAVVRARDECKAPYLARVAEIDAKTDELKAQIIEAWDGEKKTMVFDAGTLKFRTTQSLMISNPSMLLDTLVYHFDKAVITEKYISGFNKTAVKKFIDLHPQPTVAELFSKTTVKLEVDG